MENPITALGKVPGQIADWVEKKVTVKLLRRAAITALDELAADDADHAEVYARQAAELRTL